MEEHDFEEQADAYSASLVSDLLKDGSQLSMRAVEAIGMLNRKIAKLKHREMFLLTM
jgi:hypothetical protein